jgi:uncharacterized protein YndB with AHSA1/START domain
MEKSADGKHRIVVRRRMPAPRELVYDAWIDPDGIRQWMCPGDVLSAEAMLDVRVGGSFRIVMKAKDGVHEHTGTYQTVDRPSKLVFTWSTAENPGEMTLVSVDFLARGNETDLVITHEGFTKTDVAQRYEMGWSTIAGKFSEHLSRRTSKIQASSGSRSRV